MVPALEPGDYLLARRHRDLVRADIVVFEHPSQPAFWLVKRLIGLPGESISISSGLVRIGDAALIEPWASERTAPDGTWTLGPDEAFVLSDNRAETLADSRTFGAIGANSLLKVRARYWPIGRLHVGRFHR